MKKLILTIAVFTLILSLVAGSAVMAAPPARDNGQAGRSNVAHLYLYEKNPSTWEIVEDGAWGKMKYNLSGSTFDFVFNGHDLEAGWDYTLIYYPDPWPGNGLICLGSGTATGDGDVHIMGSVDTGDLPIATDKNNLSNPDHYPWINEDYNGAKIWLVLSGDVDCETAKMIGWSPTEYLFEYDLITFDDTDD